jgi:arylsulfatase A-like enzyme
MKNIYALITQVDQACREIVDEIKKQGLYNNTMIKSMNLVKAS